MTIRNLAVVVMLSFSGPIVAQESSPAAEDVESAKLRALIDRSVEGFELLPARSGGTALVQKSVMRWTNDERDSHSVGLLQVWIDRGEPAAVMATYSWAGNLYHEFDLLSREPVTASRDSIVVWKPKTARKFHPIPMAPKVEAAAPARLRQMKALSEQFSATMMGWRPDRSDRSELRRLPRELYRYQPESTDLIDGAIFAFVQGTDPEALLLIEAVRLKTGTEWQYAFIRQTSGELQGRHLEQVVWSEEMHSGRTDPTGIGLTFPSGINLKSELAK